MYSESIAKSANENPPTKLANLFPTKFLKTSYCIFRLKLISDYFSGNYYDIDQSKKAPSDLQISVKQSCVMPEINYSMFYFLRQKRLLAKLISKLKNALIM